MKLNLRPRDYILIASFWLVGCTLLTVVVYFGVWQTRPGPEDAFRPQATFTVAYNEVTAQSAQLQALQQAQSIWSEDAELQAVVSTWDKTALNEVGKPSDWTYRFYSPSQRRMFFVTITPQGEVIGTLHGERIYTRPPLVSIEDWIVDSPEAISLWLNHGGATMLGAMPGIQIVAQLQVNNEESPLTWTVVGYDRISQNYHSIFIDAKNSEILQIESSLQ